MQAGSAGVIELFFPIAIPPPRKNDYIAIFPHYLDRRKDGYIVDPPLGK